MLRFNKYISVDIENNTLSGMFVTNCDIINNIKVFSQKERLQKTK